MSLISRYAWNSCAIPPSHRPFQTFRGLSLSWVIPVLFVLLAQQAVTAQDSQAQDAQAHDAQAHDHASLGISLARHGKLGEAETELQQAVHVAPGVALYRAQLGSIFGLEGKWKEALVSFQKAVDLEPTNVNFRRETAAVQWQLGLMSSAEKNLNYVLNQNPDDAGAVLLLGLVNEKKGDYETAARLLNSQFDLVISQPDRAVALFNSWSRSGQRSNFAKIVDVLRLRANDPGWASAISRCAQIAVSADDLETAEALFSLIPMSEPSRPGAGLQLASLLYNRGQVSEAKQLLLQLAEQGAVSADLQALLGRCFEAEHHPDLALQAYQGAINVDPSRIDYYQDVVSLLLDLGKTADAITFVNRALSIAPNDARPWVWKGIVALRRNAYKEAIESYQYASRLDKSNADAVLGVAAVHFVAGETDAAVAQYRAGIAQFPKDPRFYVACAEMLLASPNSAKLQAEAQRLLESAVKLAPRSAEARYQLGQLALQQRRWKDAETEFSLSLQTDPNQSKTHFALSALYRKMGRTEDARRQFAIYQDLKRTEEDGMQSAIRGARTP
jgi:tetratricopeptide (TPR) repeat protein